MTFAAPAMLWTLLALLPLVGVYFLKVRPRRRPTTAYFLWEKIFHERRSNRLWHRLRSLWSLLLMALAFIAVAVALAEPRFVDADRPDLLIIVDNSASMQADSDGQTRLEAAKEEARDIARALDGVQRAAVATVADRLRYQSHLTDNPRDLLAAIDRIEPTYEAFRAEALAPLADAKEDDARPNGDAPSNQREPEEEAADGASPDEPQDWKESRRVLLVSDGVLGGGQAPEGIDLVRMGQTKSDNVGLVAADMQYPPGGGGGLSFYYQVAATSESAQKADLLLSRVREDGAQELTKVIPLTIEPGMNRPHVLSVSDAQPGAWIAELDVDDALDADDRAYLVARRPPPVRVGVRSNDPFFFENSVHAFSGASGGLALVEGDGDVTLAKGSPGDARRAIIFQPEGDAPFWSGLGDPAEVGAARVVAKDHTILRHIDPLSISFDGARSLTTPPGSRVLVESETGVPLVYVASTPGRSAVVVNLDPVLADFYFSAWFPALVHSAAKHLVGQEQPLLAVYPSAAQVELPGVATNAPATARTPDGATIELPADEPLRVAQPGFYHVERDGGVETVSCSLLAANETLLDARGNSQSPANLASGAPPSTWLIVLAMVVLTAESVLYHRRKVG